MQKVAGHVNNREAVGMIFDHAPKGNCDAPATRAVEESLTECGVWAADEA